MIKKVICLVLIISSTLLASEIFTLGEVNITDKENKNLDINKISSNDLRKIESKDLAKVLSTQAGISFVKKGGRAESSISIRGLDARRIGVYIDGIPVFVPYDGNFDYSRFLSTQFSSIDISEGFSSVFYGPNTMAGAINLISKKPTKAFEGSFSTQSNFDNKFHDAMNLNTLYLGSKQEKYYFSFNGTIYDRSHYNVSNHFSPTKTQGMGEIARSGSENKTMNIKAGFTPDAYSEYVFGYGIIDSQKSQALTIDTDLAKPKYWDWPIWDSQSLYFIANKTYGTSTFNFKIFRNTYTNTLDMYKNGTYTKLDEVEDSKAYSQGASFSYTNFSLKKHILKVGVNFKQDSDEITREITKKDDSYKDNVFSFEAQDVYQANEKLKLITALSYDYTKPEYATTANKGLDTASNHGLNPEIGVFYDSFVNQTTRFTIAQKTHLPSMKERYSLKHEKSIPNPNLKAELARHFELGHEAKITKNLVVDGDIFYINVQNPIISKDYNSTVRQSQNSGTEHYKGFEASIKYANDIVKTGANYTYTDISKEGTDYVTDVPKNEVHLFAYYNFYKFTLGGDVSYANDIMSEKNSSSSKKSPKISKKKKGGGGGGGGGGGTTVTSYQKLPGIFKANISLKYMYSKDLNFVLGAENLSDENYSYRLGYPESGREYYAKLTYNF